MPKRTTPFQMTVHAVRKQTASPGVTVTESKEYPDPRPDVDPREVDIVVEGDFDGDPVVTSIEVIEQGRPASINWVEQQIGKHRSLPTRTLILVSKSGFSKNALAAVAAEGSWVVTMTPVDVRQDGELIEQSIFLDQLQLTPESMVLEIQHQDQGTIAVTPQQDTTIFDGEGAGLGSALGLAKEALNVDWAVKSIQVLAHNHPEREALERVSLALDIKPVGYQLRDDETGGFHPILAAHVEARLTFNQAEIRFRTTDLGGRRFGQGRGIIFDREAVWVATTDPETDQTTISWRTTDDKPLFSPPPPPPPIPELRFRAIRELPPPPDWVDPVGREHPL